MILKFHLLLLVYCSSVVQISRQEEGCNPKTVSNLRVNEDLTLAWSIRPSELCNISYFIVNIFIGDEQTLYTTEEASMDVGFLPNCASTRISVTAISSDDVEGPFYMIFFTMPVPPDANFSLEYLTVHQQLEDGVILEWDLDEEWRLCTKSFRVVIHNEVSDNAEDRYVVANSIILHDLRPCQTYTFGVRAMHSVEQEGPITSVKYSTPSRRIDRPMLQRITLQHTRIDLEWKLESYMLNSCEVTSIVIDSSPNFRETYPIRDTPQRPVVSTRITGLQPDILYFLNVTVINTVGHSLPFLTAVQTLANN